MDNNRSDCDCIYCKDMREIQEFHDNGGYPSERSERNFTYIRDE